jgi:hypothetical protein
MRISNFDDPVIARFFSQEVFSLLLQKERISPAQVQKMLPWKHSGFSVHSKVRAMTKKEAEKVGKYMIRPLGSLERFYPSLSALTCTFLCAINLYISSAGDFFSGRRRKAGPCKKANSYIE